MTVRKSEQGRKRPRSEKGVERGGRPLPAAPAQDKAVQTFYQGVPVDAFREALELSQDEKFSTLARLMLDPVRRNQSFASKMIIAGVTLPDLYDFWSKHQLHAGLLRMLYRVPKVLSDTAKDAEAHETACNRCDGLGTVVDMIPGVDDPGPPRICPVCDGSKKMRVVGDRDCRESVFDALGLNAKKSGTSVNIQQNFGLEAELGDVLLQSQKVITGGKSE